MTQIYEIRQMANQPKSDMCGYRQWFDAYLESGDKGFDTLVGSLILAPMKESQFFPKEIECGDIVIQCKKVRELSATRAIQKYQKWLNEGLDDKFLLGEQAKVGSPPLGEIDELTSIKNDNEELRGVIDTLRLRMDDQAEQDKDALDALRAELTRLTEKYSQPCPQCLDNEERANAGGLTVTHTGCDNGRIWMKGVEEVKGLAGQVDGWIREELTRILGGGT